MRAQASFALFGEVAPIWRNSWPRAQAGHFEGLNLCFYNRESHESSLNFVNSSSGTLSQPTIGEFKNGRSEFFDQETLSGRAILVRFVISDVTPNSCHFEQAFPDDGGKTWEVNWIATDTGCKKICSSALTAAADPARDRTMGYDELESRPLWEAVMQDVISETKNAEAKQFDFLEGEWNALCRFPLPDGSWGAGPGSMAASKVLDGCISLEFFTGPYLGTTIKGLGLRAFNPQTSQWEHTWTDTSAPGGFLVWRGRFEGNVIDLHGQWQDETGHHVLSRLTWSRITERSAHWESHRSLDDGKTWTPHWVIDFTRKTTS